MGAPSSSFARPRVSASTSPKRPRRWCTGTPKVPGNGRVYYVGFTARDASGAACSGTVKVCVPHDQGQRSTCIDDGPKFDSFAR